MILLKIKNRYYLYVIFYSMYNLFWTNVSKWKTYSLESYWVVDNRCVAKANQKMSAILSDVTEIDPLDPNEIHRTNESLQRIFVSKYKPD